MDIETVREYCLQKKGTEECLPFDDTTLVIKVMGKMFILIDLEGSNHICLKCEPEYAIELRERYNGWKYLRECHMVNWMAQKAA